MSITVFDLDRGLLPLKRRSDFEIRCWRIRVPEDIHHDIDDLPHGTDITKLNFISHIVKLV